MAVAVTPALYGMMAAVILVLHGIMVAVMVVTIIGADAINVAAISVDVFNQETTIG